MSVLSSAFGLTLVASGVRRSFGRLAPALGVDRASSSGSGTRSARSRSCRTCSDPLVDTTVPKTVAPYGSWPSPISIEALGRAPATRASATPSSTSTTTACSGSSSALRRAAARRCPANDGRDEVTPPGFDARTRVHEYGGGAAWRHGDSVFFSSFADGRVYRVDAGRRSARRSRPNRASRTRSATRTAASRRTARTVDLRARVARRRDVVNELVAFPADGSEEPRVSRAGRDFYAAPRISPDGARLAWLAWDHPLLPFIGCELWASGVDGSEAELLAGGPDEAVVPAGVEPGRPPALGVRPRRLVEPLSRRASSSRRSRRSSAHRSGSSA